MRKEFGPVRMADHAPNEKDMLDLPIGTQDDRLRRRPRVAELGSDTHQDGVVPPLTKLVSRIPPPPRLPNLDGDRWAPSARPTTERPAERPAERMTRTRAHASPSAPQTRHAATLQAWGAVIAALLSGGLLVWSSVTPQAGKGVTAVSGMRAGGSETPLQHAQKLVAEADALQEQKQWAQAEARYVLALEDPSSEANALRGLCRTNLARNDGQRALFWAKRLLLTQPGSADGNLMLGDAEVMLGHRREALYAWQRARALGSAAAASRIDAQ